MNESQIFKFNFYIILFFAINLNAEKIQSNSKIPIIDFEKSHLSKAKNYENYLIGELELQRNNLEKAKDAFDEVFSNNEVKEGRCSLFRLFLKQKRFDEIINQKEKMDDSLESNLILLQAYLNLNKKQEAYELLNKLQERFPDNEQITYFNVVIKTEMQNPLEALAILNKFLNKVNVGAKHFIFYFLKSQILIAMGNEADAYKAIKECINLYPKFDQGWKFKANLEDRMGKTDEAIKSYKKLIEIGQEIESEDIRRLISLLFSQKRYAEAKEELTKIPNKNVEYYFDLALIEKNLKNYDESLKNVKKALEINPKFYQAKSLKIDLLLLMQKENEALQELKKFIDEDSKDKSSIKLILSLKQIKNNKDIASFIDNLSKKHSKNKLVLSALADLAIAKNFYQKAADLTEQIIKLSSHKEDILKTLIINGQINLKLKQYNKAIQVAQEALKIDKNYLEAINLLAYSYALEGKRLKNALELIQSALKDNQNNPIFLDTKSFILYKMGNKNEAKRVLMQAKMISPFNQTIKKHENEFK